MGHGGMRHRKVVSSREGAANSGRGKYEVMEEQNQVHGGIRGSRRSVGKMDAGGPIRARGAHRDFTVSTGRGVMVMECIVESNT